MFSVMLSASITGGMTVTVQAAVSPLAVVAVTVALPSLIAETNPVASTVATASLLLLQITVLSSVLSGETVIWSSSDEAVATVDATGLVSAIREGKATVTAATANGLTASCTVTVIPPVIEADGITLNITQTEIYTDGTLQLMATVSPAPSMESIFSISITASG